MSPTVQAVEVVQSAYAAFGRGDTPALLSLIADDVEWKFIGAKGLPYTGTFRTRDEVANWFAGIPEVDDVLAFEPREFMPAGDNVTVLGWERTQTRPSGDRMGPRLHGAQRSYRTVLGNLRHRSFRRCARLNEGQPVSQGGKGNKAFCIPLLSSVQAAATGFAAGLCKVENVEFIPVCEVSSPGSRAATFCVVRV